MHLRASQLVATTRSRLTWKLAGVVFLSILLVEAGILIGSYEREKMRQLDRLRALGAPVAQTVADLAIGVDKQAPTAVTQSFLHDTPFRAIVASNGKGERLLSVGEPIAANRELPENRRDFSWTRTGRSGVPVNVVIRYDMGRYQLAMSAYLWRIIYLIVLISALVTVGLMIGLGPLLLTPLVRLRNHLAIQTGDGVPEFPVSASDLARKDELGEIARAVNELNSRVVSRTFFDEVLQSMSDLLIVTNARHEIILVNRALLQAVNRLEAEVLGKPFSVLLPDHAVKSWFTMQRWREEGNATYETTLVSDDGNHIDVRLSVSALIGSDGVESGVVCIAQDIRDYVEAASGLIRSEQRFRDFTASAADWYWEMDEALRFSFFSERFTEVTGVEPQMLLGKTRQETGIPNVAIESWNDHLRALAEHKPFRDFVHPRTQDDGTTIWLAINGSPRFDENGEFLGYRGTGSDITARVQMEQELISARDMSEQAARAKSEFLANMSHELRTPLNGVIGMTDILLETELDSAQREYAETASSAGQVLLTLINDILDLSKLEAAAITIERIPFDFNTEVENTVQAMAELAHRKGLELLTDLDTNITSVEGDPNRIRQVLTNLVGNAVKFTAAGQVLIRTNLMDSNDEALVVRFEVEDSGIGINADALETLFSPFTQADASTTREFGGTGLGLSISKQLVELMGGEIGAGSEVGNGSTFWFTVRLSRSSLALSSDADGGLAALEDIRVLCVDDNETNLEILHRQLSDLSANVSTACSGAEALELVEKSHAHEPYTLFIIDYQMPGMDGIELARALRTDRRHIETPVVLLSSVVNRAELGSSPHITQALSKPVRRRHLIDALRHTIQTLNPQIENGRASNDAPDDVTQEHSTARSDGRPASALSERAANPIGLHVLVVEDNIVNQKVATNMLQKLGCTSELAGNGQEALERVAAGEYDLILMDCQMPVMDGYAATQAIRRGDSSASTRPIVAMTANALAGDRQECEAAGMDDHLTKPVTMERLAKTLLRWKGDIDPPAALDKAV